MQPEQEDVYEKIVTIKYIRMAKILSILVIILAIRSGVRGQDSLEVTTEIADTNPDTIATESLTPSSPETSTEPSILAAVPEISTDLKNDTVNGNETVTNAQMATTITSPAAPSKSSVKDSKEKPIKGLRRNMTRPLLRKGNNNSKPASGAGKGNSFKVTSTVKPRKLFGPLMPQVPVRKVITNPVIFIDRNKNSSHSNGTAVQKQKTKNAYNAKNSDEVARSHPMSVFDLAQDWMKHERKTSLLRLADKFGFEAAVMFNKSLSNEKLEALTWTGDKPPKPKKWLVSSDSAKLIEGKK